MSAEPSPTELAAIRTAHQALRNSRTPGTYLVEQIVGALANAQMLMSPEIAAELKRLRAAVLPAVESSPLTPMQREVLAGVVLGELVSETAARLVLSASTIRTHRDNACRAMGARNPAQAAILADRAGLLTLPAARREGDS